MGDAGRLSKNYSNFRAAIIKLQGSVDMFSLDKPIIAILHLISNQLENLDFIAVF
jgi:hypothetical protein